MRAGLHGIEAEQRAFAGCCGDHDVAFASGPIGVGRERQRAAVSYRIGGDGLFKIVMGAPVAADIDDRLQGRHQTQRKARLDACLHTGAEDAQLAALRPRQLLEAEAAGRARAQGGDDVAVDDAQRTARVRVEEQDGGLMRFAAERAIAGPEAGCLEAENLPARDAA